MAKVDWNLDYNEQEAVQVNGTEFHVKRRIPHVKKMEMVEEFVSAVAMIEDSGSASWNPYHDMFWTYLLVKYYTDIELHDDDNIGWIHDFAIEYDLEDVIRGVAGKDASSAYTFAFQMVETILRGWEQSHSIQGTLARLTSEDEMKRLAEAAPLNEELIDLLKMKQDMDTGVKVAPLLEFARKDK